MNKQIKKELRELLSRKKFLEKVIKWRINDLNFFNHLYKNYEATDYKQEMEKLINYLDITWREYSELKEKIKGLKHDLQHWKIVR